MTISVAIRIKGQAAGLPYQATAGEAITATLDSVAGVNSVRWSVAAGDDLVAPAAYTLVTSGVKGENVAFNASATVGTALLLQAVVNADPTLYARAKVYVPAANGLETGADGEGYEGNATHGTTGIQNAAIRASGVGVAVPVARTLTATTPIRIDGGASADLSADRTLSILAASGAVAGSMSAAHYTLVNGATATPTASSIAKWGASIDMGAALLYDSAGGTVPSSGFINVGATSTIVAGHSATGAATRLLLRWAAVKLFVGEEADEMQLDAVSAAHLGVSGSKSIYVTANGIQLFGAGATDFASGVGVIGLASAATEASANPAAGKAVAWLYGGALKMRSPKGLVSTLARDADATQALQVDDKWWRTAQTTDVAAAVATYADALPVNSQFALELNVVGVQHGTDTRCHFKLISSGGRAGGGLTIDATDVQTIFDAIGVSGVPTVTNSSNRPQLNMLGKAATTIDWTSFGTICIVAPTP